MGERPILFSGPMIRALLAGRKTQTRRIVDLERLRVRLPYEVRSDLPEVVEMPVRRAKPGTHPASMNPHGAVAVGKPGELLGVKPGEFDFVCPYAVGTTRLVGGVWTIEPHGENRLWVRETWRAVERESDGCDGVLFAADGAFVSIESTTEAADLWMEAYANGSYAARWRPSIFMPRWASRLTLNVTAVRVERLHEINEAAILAEGVACPRHDVPGNFCAAQLGGDCDYLRKAFIDLWNAINGDGSWESKSRGLGHFIQASGGSTVSANSSIEWTQATWNPVRGCSIVSPGCTKCYAMKTAYRFNGPGMTYEGLTRLSAAGPTWTGDVRMVPEKLAEPLHWREPKRIFVNSMSDLFHEEVPVDFIEKVFAVMANCPQHTFQVLTKRAKRMAEVVGGPYFKGNVKGSAWRMVGTGPDHERLEGVTAGILAHRGAEADQFRWPLRNVWLGVSVEDQQRADERIPELLRCPAAVRFLSVEPQLGPVDLTRIGSWRGEPLTALEEQVGHVERPPVDWVIVGGESGPGARPFHLEWARSIVAQCKAAGTAVFVKQLGAHVGWDGHSDHETAWPKGTLTNDTRRGYFKIELLDRKGGTMEEWPSDLRVREFPAGRPA